MQNTSSIETLIQDNRDRILHIAQKHGARNIRVFGSVVRGEADQESDIDLLVDLGENLSPWFPVRLIQELEALLGRRVDVVTEKSLKARIRQQVLAEARPL
jgi:hypothetical protein